MTMHASSWHRVARPRKHAARERLRRLEPIGTPDQNDEGLPPAVHHRLLMGRECMAADQSPT
jgi:hypothetical protein